MLRGQQRYFSHRAILVAIVSQNSFMVVFMGYCTITARYVVKWGVALTCLCEAKCQGGGVIAPFRGSGNLPHKVSHNIGIAVVSQHRATRGHQAFPRPPLTESPRLFRTLFGPKSDTFWTPGPEDSVRLFGDSFGIPGPEGLGDPTEIPPPLSRDRCSNTPVELCFLYRRLSLLHSHFFPLKWPIAVRRQA